MYHLTLASKIINEKDSNLYKTMFGPTLYCHIGPYRLLRALINDIAHTKTALFETSKYSVEVSLIEGWSGRGHVPLSSVIVSFVFTLIAVHTFHL